MQHRSSARATAAWLRATDHAPAKATPRAAEEEELFLGGDIYVAWYPASQQASSPAARMDATPFAILVPPLFEEGARTRKVMVNLARDLAAAGIHAVRFDYPGTGLSPAPHEAMTLAGAWDALDRVVAWCQGRGARALRLIGLRFGGHLALTALPRLAPAVDARVVAWEPVLDLPAYFQEALRVEMSNQMVTFGQVRRTREALVADLRAGRGVLVDGNRVCPALFHELDAAGALDLSALAPHRERVRLLLWESKKLHEAAGRAGLTSALVPDVKFSWKHIRSLEARSPSLFAATLQAVTP